MLVFMVLVAWPWQSHLPEFFDIDVGIPVGRIQRSMAKHVRNQL
jgi:hypothetical protein